MRHYKIVEEKYDEFYLILDPENERPPTVWNIYDEDDELCMEGFESYEEAKQMAELIVIEDECEEELRRAVKLVVKRSLRKMNDRQEDFFLLDDPEKIFLDYVESFFDGMGTSIVGGHLRCVLGLEKCKNDKEREKFPN